LKRTFSALFVSIVLGMGLVSCGGSSANTTTSGLTYRAFISNPVIPSITGAITPGLNIIDASQDIVSLFNVSLSGAANNAGMLVESPHRDRTIVFSPPTNSSNTNTLAIVDNAKESASGSVTLPGPTESMFVSNDNTTLYAAVPTAPVTGQPAGAVVQIDLTTPGIVATIPIPGARFVFSSPSGNQILAVSDSMNTVTLVQPSLISQGTGLVAVSGSFDKPVWAVFSSDGSAAFVMNCGAQCGGTAASIGIIDMTQSPPAVTSTVPVAAATMGLLSGGNLYVVGSPLVSGVDCQANLCGVLSVFPGADLTVPPSTFAVTDGYHDRMVMGPNNQLFIGARTCTNVIGSSTRGCLSVFAGAKVYAEAQNGDVTGIRAIDGRTVVYVCEGGTLQIYDTTEDLGPQQQLQLQTTQIAITGQAIDVILPDFANGPLITN
jgi:hypothetical protein